MRDDITQIPGTKLGRQYARLSGKVGMNGNKKEKLFNKLQAATVGKSVNTPMRPEDVGEYTDGSKFESALGSRAMGRINALFEEDSSTKQYLTMLAQFAGRVGKDGVRRSMESFVLEHGHEYQTGPDSFPGGGEKRMCYMNAFNLARGNPDLTYVEGFATNIIPVMHAWCVDLSGLVIDPTWDGGEAYMGVPFKLDFVEKTIWRKQTYGVIDDIENKWPLVFAKVAKEEFYADSKQGDAAKDPALDRPRRPRKGRENDAR